jgi:hypothetical protein
VIEFEELKLLVPPAPEHLQERKNIAEVHPVLAETAKPRKPRNYVNPQQLTRQ